MQAGPKGKCAAEKDEATALWPFMLKIYAAPGVAPACLRLQETYGWTSRCFSPSFTAQFWARRWMPPPSGHWTPHARNGGKT